MNIETGKLCWFDFPVKDEAKAKTFYSKVFGWQWEEMAPNYWMAKVGDETIGGIRKEKKFTPATGFTAYFAVPSVKEGRTVITKAGGKTVGESVAIAEGEHGYFQLFTDLDGNNCAMWSKKP